MLCLIIWKTNKKKEKHKKHFFSISISISMSVSTPEYHRERRVVDAGEDVSDARMFTDYSNATKFERFVAVVIIHT